MERFVNLTNRCLAVFLNVEFYSRNQGWNETNWRNAEKYRDLCLGGANLRIFLGLILFYPVVVALIKMFGNNVWTTLSSFVLSIGLSFLFHWYFVTYKCKWHKYWEEYERQTKHQHRVWMAITNSDRLPLCRSVYSWCNYDKQICSFSLSNPPTAID